MGDNATKARSIGGALLIFAAGFLHPHWIGGAFRHHLPATLLALAGIGLILFDQRYAFAALLGFQTQRNVHKQVLKWLTDPEYAIAPVKDPKERFNAEWAYYVEQTNVRGGVWKFTVLHRSLHRSISVQCSLKYGPPLAGHELRAPTVADQRALDGQLAIALSMMGSISVDQRKIGDFDNGFVIMEVEQEVSGLNEYAFATLVHTARRANLVAGKMMDAFMGDHTVPIPVKRGPAKKAAKKSR